MKVLVLGGCGFIGSHVVDRLLEIGHKVRVFDRSPEMFRPNLPLVDYRLADFADSSALAEALEGIDVVYHMISTTVPSTSNLDPVADVRGNLINTLRLLQLLVQKQIRKIVYLSSGGTIYGVPENVPIREDHKLNPICSYGIVKLAVENYLHMFHHLHGLQYTVLRGSNPYGERQGHLGVQGVIATFLNKIKSNEEIEIWGDGTVVRDFIYIKDLAELCVLAANSDVSGIINAGSGKGYSLNEIVEVIGRITGREVYPVYRSRRSYDVPKVVLDMTHAFEIFRWQPRTELPDGIMRTWEWIKEQS